MRRSEREGGLRFPWETVKEGGSWNLQGLKHLREPEMSDEVLGFGVSGFQGSGFRVFCTNPERRGKILRVWVSAAIESLVKKGVWGAFCVDY